MTLDLDLDLDFVRSRFPQANQPEQALFCANAGGSFVAQPVLDIFEHYNRHTRVQPYSNFAPSHEAGAAMDRARECWAAALNVNSNEITFGPSTSINTYVMAHAIAASLQPGDEIIVSQQEHEANSGAWRRIAAAQGAAVVEWPIEPSTGLLDPDALYSQLTERTRWVFFTHCSNLIGTVNPAADIVRGIRSRSNARVGVDAVAYAPHHLPDLKALDVDLYFFSLYKVFGPHQGLMYIKPSIVETLTPQSHHFLTRDPAKAFNPSGPQHAEVAAAAGVIDYLEELINHHGLHTVGSLNAQLQLLHERLNAHESALATGLLDYLGQRNDVRVLGKTHTRDSDRAATISFLPLNQTPNELVARLQAEGIGTECGHFYAERVLRGMDLDPAVGVVRLSLLHYNPMQDVARITAALDRAMDAH